MFEPDTPLMLLALCEKNRPQPDTDSLELELEKKTAICEITIAFRTYQMNLPLDAMLKEDICEAGAAAIEALSRGNLWRADLTNEKAAGEFRRAYDNLVTRIQSMFWKVDRQHLWPLVPSVL